MKGFFLLLDTRPSNEPHGKSAMTIFFYFIFIDHVKCYQISFKVSNLDKTWENGTILSKNVQILKMTISA